MTLAAEKELAHIGESRGCEDHDYDLIQELSRRLESLWRCDQYIANADGHPDLQGFWRDIKRQEQSTIKRLKELVCSEVKKGCF